MKCKVMEGRGMKDTSGSSGRMYIHSTGDITPNCSDIRNTA